ncbi:uncharacterized protein [Mobula birostris]|uniref:uncharacterized protein n=1 Tax=Mobula birostris TaxID=1983395 RepID=UPI003B286D31
MASRSSTKSFASSAKSSRTLASVAALARAKAEAAKVRASYANQEAKLKIEKAARGAESITRDTQNQLEKATIDTELEVLTLQREADAAVVEAQVLENAEEMHILDETGKSISERAKLECTSEYVQSQIDLQIHSPSPYLPAGIPSHVKSQGSFIASRPPGEDNSQLQPFNKLKYEKADYEYFPTPNLPDPTRAETKAEVRTSNPSHTSPNIFPQLARHLQQNPWHSI